MTAAAWILVLCAAAVAVADWVAVATETKPAEMFLKPLVMMLLVAVVYAMDLEGTALDARSWFVGALLLSMIGDVFLLWPDRTPLFMGGLLAFLVGHIAYIGGLFAIGLSGAWVLVGVALIGLAVVTLGRRVIGGVAESDEPQLLVPVIAYVAVISLMVVAAVGTGITAAAVGAILFYSSDAQIAWNRFIGELPMGRLGIMTTYHLGQLGLVLALAA